MSPPAALPERRTPRTLKIAARRCRACHLWRHATQTVSVKATRSAEVMLVGEQPGHDEALLGSSFKVSLHRGRFVQSPLAPLVTTTFHPSSILREPDSVARREAMRAFVRDLKKVKARL